MSVLYLPDCPDSCEGYVNPVSFNECAPETHWGEISKVYVAPADLDLTGFDCSSLSDWTALLADTGDDKIRTLIGIGDMPEPEVTEVSISGDRKAYGFKKFSFNFNIDETNDTNYMFMAMTECNGTYLFWFETSDGILYGGNEGITGSIKMNQVIPESRADIVKIMGVFSWQAQRHPYRCASPMY